MYIDILAYTVQIACGDHVGMHEHGHDSKNQHEGVADVAAHPEYWNHSIKNAQNLQDPVPQDKSFLTYPNHYLCSLVTWTAMDTSLLYLGAMLYATVLAVLVYTIRCLHILVESGHINGRHCLHRFK